MEAVLNQLKQVENSFLGEKFTDEATKMKIHKHLNDINDTITEDDIRNIRLFVPVSNPSERDRGNGGRNGSWHP